MHASTAGEKKDRSLKKMNERKRNCNLVKQNHEKFCKRERLTGREMT